MARKRGPKSVYEQHKPLGDELEKWADSSLTDTELLDQMRAIIRKLKINATVTYYGLKAQRTALLERRDNKLKEQLANTAFVEKFGATMETVGAANVLSTFGRIIQTTAATQAIDSGDMAELQEDDSLEDRLLKMEITAKQAATFERLTRGEKNLQLMRTKERELMARQLIEAAQQEKLVVSGGESDPVEFVQRLIQQVNATTGKQT